MKVIEILNNIFLVEGEPTKNIAKTLMRLQKSTVFPQDGCRSFSDDIGWKGFGVPDHVFEILTSDLPSEEEQELFNCILKNKKEYYVVGYNSSLNGSIDILKHELCHALYHTNKDYRREVDEILSDLDMTRLIRFLRFKVGYCRDVIWDECHAHLCENCDYLRSRKVPYPLISDSLQYIKRRYLKKDRYE